MEENKRWRPAAASPSARGSTLVNGCTLSLARALAHVLISVILRIRNVTFCS